MKLSSHRHWKLFGEKDPYFGVLSDEKFKNENLSEASIREFYRSGELFVDETEQRVSRLFNETLKGKSTLDFGCGVGRLTVAFARKTGAPTVGVDISEGMLTEARNRSAALGVENLEFWQYDGFQLPALERFDVINSYIVLQHIEPKAGYGLLKQLCDRAKKGGIVQLHLTYGQVLPKLTYWNFYMRTQYSLYNYLYSLLRKGRLSPEPVMQMNHYQLDKVFKLFSAYTSNTNVEFTDHGGHLGAIFCFKRDKE